MINAVYTILLLIGSLGLLAQVLMGGHIGHHTLHSHSFRNAGISKGVSGKGGSRRGASFLLSLLSPITFFSLCLGAGATGIILKNSHLPSTTVMVCSAVGAIALYAILVRPLISFLLNFASKPSQALEGAVAGCAEVVSRFDSSGNGIVNLTIDGQIVRVLATLEDTDKRSASEILPGERLLVTSIDGHRNACRVTRL